MSKYSVMIAEEDADIDTDLPGTYIHIIASINAPVELQCLLTWHSSGSRREGGQVQVQVSRHCGRCECIGL